MMKLCVPFILIILFVGCASNPQPENNAKFVENTITYKSYRLQEHMKYPQPVCYRNKKWVPLKNSASDKWNLHIKRRKFAAHDPFKIWHEVRIISDAGEFVGAAVNDKLYYDCVIKVSEYSPTNPRNLEFIMDDCPPLYMTSREDILYKAK